MWKIGLSSCGKEFGEELLRAYRASGIGAMELSYGREEYEGFDFAEAKRLADICGVELWSLHLPFLPFSELDISVPALQKQTVEYFKTLIRKGAEIGIRVFIIHPSGEPIKESDRPQRLETAKKSLRELAGFADTWGAVIAVEDLPRTCLGRNSSEIMALLAADPRLRVCFDTNHLLAEPIPHFIRAVGNKILTTHVSDYDFVNEKHWLPLEGKIDWPELVAALREVGYRGPWLYELGFKAPPTIIRPRDLVCEDFRKNAETLLGKQN